MACQETSRGGPLRLLPHFSAVTGAPGLRRAIRTCHRIASLFSISSPVQGEPDGPGRAGQGRLSLLDRGPGADRRGAARTRQCGDIGVVLMLRGGSGGTPAQGTSTSPSTARLPKGPVRAFPSSSTRRLYAERTGDAAPHRRGGGRGARHRQLQHGHQRRCTASCAQPETLSDVLKLMERSRPGRKTTVDDGRQGGRIHCSSQRPQDAEGRKRRAAMTELMIE